MLNFDADVKKTSRVTHRFTCVGRDCALEQNVFLGKGATIGSNVRVVNSVIGKNCVIGTPLPVVSLPPPRR